MCRTPFAVLVLSLTLPAAAQTVELFLVKDRSGPLVPVASWSGGAPPFELVRGLDPGAMFAESIAIATAPPLRIDPTVAAPLVFYRLCAADLGCGATLAEPAEVAGDPLVEYPHFDFVQAFDDDRPISGAIDPSHHPTLVGTTCDAWVVTARSAAAWLIDPSLADIRAGGPRPLTVTAGSIADNTFPLASAGELPADGGTGLGAGYDVVLDCDRDGRLSAADRIDGFAFRAGFHVVHDFTASGPLAVASFTDLGPDPFDNQIVYYPTDIATMGRLPLVVLSHGNGHNYTWYEYLQEHLGSYGYIVMSHQNDTRPGIEAAATTTLSNTERILAEQATIGGGPLDGHIDGERIVWIGHSRGGEGVARAYDRLHDGEYIPLNFAIDDIALVSSIAPTDYLSTDLSNPHDVTYHLLFGSADGDVCGCPDPEHRGSFHLYERATARRFSTYLHGADHNDFNCCGFDDFTGPPGTAIGRDEAQAVAKATYLALLDHVIDDRIAARDYLWRPHERLKPSGIAATTTIIHELRDAPSVDTLVLDDFQSEPDSAISSSGGAVTGDVTDLLEALLDDGDATFTWDPADPMNGMTRGQATDVTRGVVFSWSLDDRFYQQATAAGDRDWSAFTYLSFRACQGTRHPETIAELTDLTFMVTLLDTAGTASALTIGAYGSGLIEPYQRTGSGSGTGWQNEFETIRIRLADFLTDGTGLDLTDIAAVRFDLGPTYGSTRGRLGIDDIEVTRD